MLISLGFLFLYCSSPHFIIKNLIIALLLIFLLAVFYELRSEAVDFNELRL